MTNAVAFEPTETWNPKSEDFHLEESIEDARREINQEDSDRLIDSLRKTVKKADSGIVYAELKGNHPEEYSNTEALVLFNPFANTATANMLVRSEFIRRVAELENVRDNNGKLKPVIMLASPGIFGSRLQLDKNDKRQIRNGDLGPAVNELLKAVSAQEYGQVALLGFSQGADMAVAGTKNAAAANLDVHSMAVGDPAGVMDRGNVELGLDFLKSGSEFQSVIEDSDVEAQQTALGHSPWSPARLKDFVRFGGTSLTTTNRAIWSGLGKNSFEANMQAIISTGGTDKLVVGYGAKDTITQASAIEPALAKLHTDVADNRLISVRVEGAGHAWGDNLPLLAKLYLRALV